MNIEGKGIEKVIDDYYEDKASSNEGKKSQYSQFDDLEEKFNRAMEKMDVLKYTSHELDVNILQIIADGESIRNEKKAKKEFILFLVLASCILFVVASLSIVVSMKIFIFLQIAILSIMPLSIIPIAVVASKERRL